MRIENSLIREATREIYDLEPDRKDAYFHRTIHGVITRLIRAAREGMVEVPDEKDWPNGSIEVALLAQYRFAGDPHLIWKTLKVISRPVPETWLPEIEDWVWIWANDDLDGTPISCLKLNRAWRVEFEPGARVALMISAEERDWNWSRFKVRGQCYEALS